MLRTNSKQVTDKIKTIITDCYNDSSEYYGWDGREMATDYKGICKDILSAFEIEKVKHDMRYKANRIGKQDLFYEWMQGLPTAFYVADDIFLKEAVDYLGDLLEQTEKERSKYTSEQAEKTLCWLFYRELTRGARL